MCRGKYKINILSSFVRNNNHFIFIINLSMSQTDNIDHSIKTIILIAAYRYEYIILVGTTYNTFAIIRAPENDI